MMMQSIFYRYVRPLKFNRERCELETAPKGGVCLRFERVADEVLTFSFSRCHEDELFSKEVAKRVADDRAWRLRTWEGPPRPEIQQTTEKSLLVEQVIDYCLSWRGSGSPIQTYMEHEYRDLAIALVRILKKNVRAQEQLDRELERIEFLSISKEYAEA